jgi:hypothetical protein
MGEWAEWTEWTKWTEWTWRPISGPRPRGLSAHIVDPVYCVHSVHLSTTPLRGAARPLADNLPYRL